MTLERIRLAHEIGEFSRCACGVHTKEDLDPGYPQDAVHAIQAQLYDAWERQLVKASVDVAERIRKSIFRDERLANELIGLFAERFNRNTMANLINVRDQVENTLVLSKRRTVRDLSRRSGKAVKDVVFGIRVGATEDRAIDSLVTKMQLSAGDFWDEEMAETIRAEMLDWFDGSLTRDEIVNRLEKMVNNRLSIEGVESKPRHYFDGLAAHVTVRARTFGNLFGAEEVGVTHYTIEGILDNRTSPVCRSLIISQKVFTLGGARETMNKIVGARSNAEIKAKVPFLNSAAGLTEGSGPVPPLHWFCRSRMNFII